MKIITPEEFKLSFETAVKSSEDKLIHAAKNSDAEFTMVMLKKDNDNVLETVALNLGLTTGREWWYFDLFMYEERDTEHFRNKNATWAKTINVALEHENKWEKSVEEMNKLTIINSPLRVLITYPKDGQEEVLKSNFEAIIRASDWANDCSTQRRILVIFGWIGDKVTIWEYYTYTDDQKGSLVRI